MSATRVPVYDGTMQPLGTFCEFKYGKNLPEKDREHGGVAVYGSNGVVGFHRTAITSGPTIIIGRKGSAGALQYSDAPCYPIDTTYFVDASCTGADLRWLYFMLQTLGLESLSKHSALPGLNRNDAYLANLPLPPLDEQKRIAAVLDKAEALRRDRQESLTLNEKLVHSVFLDMFVKNPEATNWVSRTVEWMARDAKGSLRTGPLGSQLLHSEFVDQGIAVLGIKNAVKNRFEWGQPRFITPKKYEDLNRYKVFPGDVMITIMWTVGRCAIVPNDIPEAINTNHLCCITLDQEKCLPEFLHAAFLNHPDLLFQLDVLPHRSAVTSLNMRIIKDLKLPMPPIELQKQFKRFVAASTASRVELEESCESMERFLASLQQRAFRGELDLSRVVLDSEADAVVAPEPTKRATKTAKASKRQLQAPQPVEAELRSLDGSVSRGEAIAWSADYFIYRILDAFAVPFSFEDAMRKAEAIFDEPPYEKIKDVILEMLGQRNGGPRLHQRFDFQLDVKTSRKEMVFELAP